MIYEMTIDEIKGKNVLALLKELDYVTIRKVTAKSKPKTKAKKSSPTKDDDIPYFGAAPDWDIDASELRSRSNKKRLAGWL